MASTDAGADVGTRTGGFAATSPSIVPQGPARLALIAVTVAVLAQTLRFSLPQLDHFADEAGLGRAPERAGDVSAGSDDHGFDTVARCKRGDRVGSEVCAGGDCRDGQRDGLRVHPGVRGGAAAAASMRRTTWRARSSASARRSCDSSSSLPSTSVSS